MALPPINLPRHGVPTEIKRKIVSLHRYGVELEHLVERFGFDRDTVLRCLRDAGEVVKGARR